MKKILAFFVTVLITVFVYAQAPQKLSYQAVIRNSNAQLITNTTVGMQISILQDSLNGTVVYSETQTPTTNANGLVTIEIGGETGFDTLNWAEDPYFLKTETDPSGGTNYTITGISQLLSVPYALHAKTAENISGTINYTETDPVFNVSTAKGIKASDTANWSNKLDSYSETQNLADVIALNDSANAQIKNVTDPTDAQDAATKAYVDVLSAQFNLLKNTVQAGGPLIDIEGNVYNVVKIDTQVWMAENLKVTKFNDGTDIPLVTDSAEWVDLNTSGYCWLENDEITYKDMYGALYNFNAVFFNSLCPVGWHVPNDAEWTALYDYLGAEAGGKLKEAGTAHWSIPNTGATNETGFTALPGGSRDPNGGFSYSGGHTGLWWTSTYNSHSDIVWLRYMAWNDSQLHRSGWGTKFGFSVRCLKD